MKCTFSIWARKNVHNIIGNTQNPAKVPYKQIELALRLIDKFKYDGEKEDESIDTEITLSDEEVLFVKNIVSHPSVSWPVKEQALTFKKRIEKYAEQAEEAPAEEG